MLNRNHRKMQLDKGSDKYNAVIAAAVQGSVTCWSPDSTGFSTDAEIDAGGELKLGNLTPVGVLVPVSPPWSPEDVIQEYANTEWYEDDIRYILGVHKWLYYTWPKPLLKELLVSR